VEDLRHGQVEHGDEGVKLAPNGLRG
jgi:hypothetical protein